MADNRNYFGPLRGFIYDKGVVKTFPTPRGEFKVRNIKVEFREEGRDGKVYTTIPELSLVNDTCHVLDYDGYEVGKEVDVWFSIKGRKMEWKDKNTGEDKSAWKTEIGCIKIKAVQAEGQQQSAVVETKNMSIPPENQARMNEVVSGTTPYNPLTDEVGDDDSSGLPF